MTPTRNLEDELFEDIGPSKEELDNQNFDELIRRGKQNLEVKDYKEALNNFTQAHKIKKKDFDVWLGLGQAYHGEHTNYKEAKKAFRNATYLNPQSEEAWFGYGQNEISGVYITEDEDEPYGFKSVRGGTLDSALEAFDKAIAISPTNDQLLTKIGNELAMYTRTVPKALELWKKAVSINSKNTEALRQIVMFGKDNHLDTLKYADKLIQLEPNNADAWNAKGYVYAQEGRRYEAKNAYEKAGNYDMVRMFRD